MAMLALGGVSVMFGGGEWRRKGGRNSQDSKGEDDAHSDLLLGRHLAHLLNSCDSDGIREEMGRSVPVPTRS